MKFDPAKSYLYPVLRPRSEDYPTSEFQVDILLERIVNSTATRATADFALSDPGLLDLVAKGRAAYVLLVRCATTHARIVTSSRTPRIEQVYESGVLSGRTEFSAFLVATEDLTEFRAATWHEDFLEQSPFDIATGAVLATDYPKDYWIDIAPEAAVGSIFELVESDDVADNQWNCNLDAERVGILMSTRALDRFREARDRLNGTPDQAYLLNSVYFPALLHVLAVADVARQDYESRRWFRSLDARLEQLKRPALGASTSNRLIDAQMLLESPFAELPFQRVTGEGSES